MMMNLIGNMILTKEFMPMILTFNTGHRKGATKSFIYEFESIVLLTKALFDLQSSITGACDARIG